MANAADRVIELAEDRLRIADALGLSVSGKLARIYKCLEADDVDEACEHLDAIDQLINEARTREAGGAP